MKDFELIRDWRNTFGLPVRTVPSTPSAQEAKLAELLINEEFEEFKESILNIDNYSFNLDEVADSIGDLYFVVTQAACIFGLDPSELIQKVYDSNMSKLCPTIEAARDTMAAYAGKGIDSYMLLAPDGVNWIIKRSDNNKVLKALTFQDPKWDYDQQLQTRLKNTL
jgi:NTP pyrophosphatase (non-canonical NTP hydrolase)